MLPTAPDTNAQISFFTALYGDVDLTSERSLVIWSPKGGGTRFCTSIDEATEFCTKLNNQGLDAYFAVSLQDVAAARTEAERIAKLKGMGEEAAKVRAKITRGFASTATVVPGVWLDVDYAGEQHAKSDLPPDADAARKLVSSLPIAPTLTVATGGGLHAYWLFHEPFEIHNDEDRAEIAAIVYGWNQMLREIAARSGWGVDSTFDLVRVLRPVGTISAKYGRLVTAPGELGPRCNHIDFDNYAEAPRARPSVEVRAALEAKGAIDESVQPPFDQLLLMIDLEPKFKATWERQRTDLPSQSEYDLSLATMVAHAGWSDEDIVALVVAHRAKHNENTKTDRLDYYASLVAKSKEGLASQEAHESLTNRLMSVDQGVNSISDEREGMLEDLSALIGLPVRTIVRYVADPPSYRLVFDDQTIFLPNVDTIISSSKFRSAVAACCGHLLGRFKGQRWDPIAQTILRCCEDQDLGADSSDHGVVGEWLVGYLTTCPPIDDREVAVASRTPLRAADGVAIFADTLAGWLTTFRGERIGRRELAVKLRSAGCEPWSFAYRRDDGSRSTSRAWKIPAALLD